MESWIPSSKAPPPPPPPKPLPPKPPMIVPPWRSKAPPPPPPKPTPPAYKPPMIVLPHSKAPPFKATPDKAPMIVPPRSKAPPRKAAPKKRKHEEVASSSSKVAKVAGSKSPAAAEATRPPLQLQATTSKSASSSSTHMYQQPRTPEVEITDDHSRDSDSLPGTPCTDQGAGTEVEEEIEVLDLYLPQERYMPRLILAKCDVCQDTEEGPKVCVSAYTQRDCDSAYKDLPKVFCKECYNAGQSL
jgi:hypothetical protein